MVKQIFWSNKMTPPIFPQELHIFFVPFRSIFPHQPHIWVLLYIVVVSTVYGVI